MTVIATRLTVSADGVVSSATPLPAGEHEAMVTLSTVAHRPVWPGRPFTMEHFPVRDDPWDNRRSLGRQDCMTKMDAEPAFVDTNVLVYASRASSIFHARARGALERARQDRRALWISRQIIWEYLAVVTRPQANQDALPMAEALHDATEIARDFNIAEDGETVFEELRRLLLRIPVAGKQVHDANVAATMLAHNLARLITFKGAAFARFSAIVELVSP